MDNGGSHTPSEEDIITAYRAVAQANPNLDRNAILVKMKTENGWEISNKQLKKVLAPPKPERPRNLGDPNAPIQLPDDAFAALERYRAESTRIFRIYGRGEYDYGVSPNSEQQIKINMCHNRLVEAGCPGPFDDEEKSIIGSAWPLQHIYNFYCAAAQKAGLTKEDVGRQLEAEYGVNPLPYAPVLSEAQVARQAAVYKQKMLPLLREMVKLAGDTFNLRVDDRGEVVWDDAINGEFVVLVVKINKGDGLTEYGQIDGLA